ncbi:MAG: hypothetical protein H7177_12005, partial [Rhizobacter sp.]|nr:hypothetical protein [Bacteriovorax sp.]
GDLLVADTTNQTIRRISSSIVTTTAGTTSISGNTNTGDVAGCTGVPNSYYFQHGDGEKIVNRAAMSVDINPANADIALSPFYGSIINSVFANLPIFGAGEHALFYYDGASQLGSPLFANQGDYIYYNGSSWTKFIESDSVKLLLQQ